MRGIDVSSHNQWPFNNVTETAYQASDFLIAKTTQGTGYVNPYGDRAIQRAIADGKPFGFYHYAGGNDAVAEANYFYEHSKNYFGHGVPVIDWEGYQNSAFGNASWVRAFVDRIHGLTGVWCMIYVSASAIPQVANCADDCALWVAGYPVNAASWDVPSFKYSIEPWTAYTVWQFSSAGGIDRNVSNIDADAWQRIAAGDGATNQQQPAQQQPEQPYYAVRLASGRWLAMMRGLTDTGGSRDDYAGIFGQPIGYVAIGGVGKYRARSIKHSWLPYVSIYNLNDLNNGCAGDGSAITGLEIPNSGIKYQVHILGGGWLPWMIGNMDTGGSRDSFAGNGKQIDAIRIARA